MAIITKEAITFLGLHLQGDLGPWTCYKNLRRGTVVYLRAPPKEPPSPLQIAFRQRWTTIATLWHALEPNDRQAWQRAARYAGLRLSGYNLFIWFHCNRDLPALTTITRISHTTLVTT